MAGFYPSDVNGTGDDVKVLKSENLETVLVGILDIVVIGKAGAVGAAMVQRIIAAGLTAVGVSEVRMAAEGLYGLIEERPCLMGAFRVVHVDGCGGRRRRQRYARRRLGAGLGRGQAGE
jgi:hypothetical protein